MSDPASPTLPAQCPQCGAPLPEGAPQGLCPACLLKQGFATRTNPTGGSSGQPTFILPTREELAAHFPQLEILELIGQGGMGAVYKVRQPALDRLAALKILPPQTAARDPGFAERFNREARALARLSHPRIVHVHDFGQAGGYYYFLMEFVDGANLRQLERAGTLSPSEALAIVPQICEALQYAHDQGIVHRDIKPENILVSKQGQIKIADFGVAKLIGGEPSPITLTNAGQMMGTPLYMAPEQVEHPSDVDHRADIYSLGVVFYEMLTGELPLGRFAAPSRKVQIDVRLDEVVFRALEKEPDLRYQQAGQVKTEVDNIQATPKLATPPTAATPGGNRPGGVGISAMKNPGSYNGPRRFSRKALVGACWAPFVILAWAFFISVNPRPPRYPEFPHFFPPDHNWKGVFLALTILPLGLLAPFGTTILGWAAVAEIRHSAGRIYGMALAVIDGLLFPLMALDVGITFLIYSFGLGFLGWSKYYNDLENSRLIFCSIIAWIAVDALILWLVWRAVNKPLPGAELPAVSAGHGTTPNPSAPVPASGWMKPATLPPRFVLMLWALAGAVIFLILWSMQQPQHRAIGAKPLAAFETNVPRSAFAAQLPHGAAVEIAGISYHPSGAQPWWNADGSPLESRDWQAQSGAPIYSNGNPPDRANLRQIVLHADGPGEKPAIVGFSFTPSAKDIEFGSDGAFDILHGGDKLPQEQWLGLFEQFKPDQTTATVKVDVGVGPYEPLPNANTTRFNDQAMATRYRGKRAVLGKLFEREGQAAISLTLDVWEGVQWRLRAQDNSGQWHEGKTVEGQSSSGLLQSVLAFEGLQVRDVAQVVIETRPTYKVEFRNVSLNPGQKKEVAVVGAEQSPPDKYGPLSNFQSIAPYPETTLTLAWDGSKRKFPDPIPYLTALRTTDEYREWQGRKDDRYFRDENAAGYHFEAHFTGMGNEQINGGMNELIPTVKIFRPRGGLVASAKLGSLYANNWDVDVYDDAGQKVVTRLRWIHDQTGIAYICRVVFDPDTPQESQWWANQFGVVYSDGKEHQLPEYETQPYPLPFPPGTAAPANTPRPTVSADQQLADAQVALAELQKDLRAKHPTVVAAQARVEALTKRANAGSADYLDELKAKLAEAEAEQAALAVDLRGNHPTMLALQTKIATIHNLLEGRPADFVLPTPAPTAASTPTPNEQRDLLNLQLQQAETEATRAETGGKAGVVSAADVQAAKDKAELLRAQIDGDPVHIAEVKLAAVERRVEAGEKLAKAGTLSQAEFAQTVNERDRARLDLQQAQARAAASPAPDQSPSFPAPAPSQSPAPPAP